MKLLTIFISLLLVLISFSEKVDALGVGSPLLPQKKGAFTTGFEAGYTRHQGRLDEYSYTRLDASGIVTVQGGLVSGEDVRDVEGETYLALASLSYALMDNAEIFLKAGGALSDWQLDWYQDGAKVSRTDIDSDCGCAVGGGIKTNLIEFKDEWKLGLSLSYLWFQTATNEFTTRDNTGRKYRIEDWAVEQNFWNGVSTANYKDDQDVQQWQASLYISKPIDKYLPYAGIKYFDFRTEYEAELRGLDSSGNLVGTEDRSIKTKAKGTVGVFAGLDCYFNEDVTFSLEASFVDELSTQASITLVF